VKSTLSLSEKRALAGRKGGLKGGRNGGLRGGLSRSPAKVAAARRNGTLAWAARLEAWGGLSEWDRGTRRGAP
jgi:hypothetical protein